MSYYNSGYPFSTKIMEREMGIHVERYGAGEKVLFIHGAGGNTELWYFQKRYLSKSMEVILVDLPGHGKSGGDPYTSVDDYCEAVYRLMDAEGIDKAIIAGQSMGGAIALSFALAHPERLSGLILLGTGAKLKVFPEILQGILKNKREAVNKIMEFAFSKKTSAQILRSGFAAMMKNTKKVIHGDFYSCQSFNVMDSLDRIGVPTLVVCGKDDFLTPPKFSEFLNKGIKNSRLVLIEDAGHMLMIEKPVETNRAIEDFVKEVARRR
jgi:pimeloyl-ACP methyl ester carboxylesterase